MVRHEHALANHPVEAADALGEQRQNPQLDVVLAADEKTRQGKHAKAIRILDALLPEIVDPELKRLVQLKRETIARKLK